jgi:hypothetical protein
VNSAAGNRDAQQAGHHQHGAQAFHTPIIAEDDLL